jgi:hypothetical protein
MTPVPAARATRWRFRIGASGALASRATNKFQTPDRRTIIAKAASRINV